MADVIQFPGGMGGHPGGGGPEDPMLEQRVAHLEDDMKELKASIRAVEMRLGGIEVSLARIEGRIAGIEGRLSQSPTWLQLLVALIATWGAGAAIVAAAVRFIPK
jgi:septal ring factor EnvC (AmiA/AmiB activator)